MQKGMSKLQVRSEVLLMLQKLCVFEDIPKSEIDKCLVDLRSSDKVDDILEILLKELSRSDVKKSQIIAYFLAELGTLEKLKDGLWGYIKDPNSSDNLKDLAGVILKSLGDDSSPEELLSYLENPDELVDKETQKLLEIASVNPEAQIDFLDFLFSLPHCEQINLIDSMKEDFTNQYLANVFVPALEANPSEELSNIIVEILGELRSPYAVAPLQDIMQYSNSDNLKKLAKKSLNLLKIAGINLDDTDKTSLGSEICEISGIYKCYASIIDGAGNQGIIVSRKKENGDILTFSTVINDIEGIVDCFGFYGISKQDFVRIVEKFKGDLAAVPVAPEYCKYKLLQAERTSKVLNNTLCYEYLCWKSLISDIKPASIEIVAKNLQEWSNPSFINDSGMLFNHPEFKYWFLSEDYSIFFKCFLEEILEDLKVNKVSYISNPDDLLGKLENKIKIAVQKAFDQNSMILYKLRLVDAAYLLDIQGFDLLRNIAASVALQLRESNIPDKVLFFYELLKKSILEYLLRYQYNLEQIASPAYKSLWKKNNLHSEVDFESQTLDKIVDILDNAWR